MADKSEEHKAEIQTVFADFGEATKTKGNFIKREIDQLKGIVDDHLKIENRFKTRKLRKLTDSGTEIVSDSERSPRQPPVTENTPAEKESGAI